MAKLNEKQLADLIATIVEEKLKEFGARETENKGVVFETPSYSAEEIEKMSAKDRFLVFLKEGVFKGDVAVVKALGGDTGANGGYLIPTEFVRDIVMDLPKISPVRGLATVFTPKSRTGEIPKLAGRPSVYMSGENVAPTESNPSFGQIAYALNKIKAFSVMSEELLMDSGIDLISLIRRLFTEGLAMAENELFTNGDGVNKPKGFTQEAGITAVATGLTYDTLMDTYYALPEQYRRNAVLMTGAKGLSALRKIKGTDGHPILTVDLRNRDIYIKEIGVRVVENPDIPENLGAGANETEIYFGDFRNYYIWDSQEYTIKTSNEGDAFDKDQVKIKLVNRIDGKVAFTEAIVKIAGVV